MKIGSKGKEMSKALTTSLILIFVLGFICGVMVTNFNHMTTWSEGFSKGISSCKQNAEKITEMGLCEYASRACKVKFFSEPHDIENP
jgi:hypothetical protein